MPNEFVSIALHVDSLKSHTVCPIACSNDKATVTCCFRRVVPPGTLFPTFLWELHYGPVVLLDAWFPLHIRAAYYLVAISQSLPQRFAKSPSYSDKSMPFPAATHYSRRQRGQLIEDAGHGQ